MHEQDFRILEGQDITLPELGKELENITDVRLLILLAKLSV